MLKRARVLGALVTLLVGVATSAEAQIKLEPGVSRLGKGTHNEVPASAADACAARCSSDSSCKAMTWLQTTKKCFLLPYVSMPFRSPSSVSGVKQAAQPAPQTGYPDGCAAYAGGPPRASLHIRNLAPYKMRLIINGHQHLRDLGHNSENTERHVLPPGRNVIQFVTPNLQYRTKYADVVNEGAKTCATVIRMTYP